jgi:RHS repeat-associated protein
VSSGNSALIHVDTLSEMGDGRRMRSKLYGATNWTNFIHDELSENILCEYTLISGTFAIKALNTYGIGLISSNREGTKRYFHFDGLGSTAALTDGSQSVTDTYKYSAFGETRSAAGSSVNPYRYVGQWGYYDDPARGSQHGLLLLGVRYYSPDFGRFWTWDHLGGLDRYLYCNSSPANFLDPTGLQFAEAAIAGSTAGGPVGFGVTVVAIAGIALWAYLTSRRPCPPISMPRRASPAPTPSKNGRPRPHPNKMPVPVPSPNTQSRHRCAEKWEDCVY